MNIKRVVIVHGWADDPTRGWMDWLVRELQAHGIEALAPPMPTPRTPDVREWCDKLTGIIGAGDEHTALVGHSLGAWVLLRYLEHYQGPQFGRLILVAGFSRGRGANPSPEPDYVAAKCSVLDIYSVYSDNDAVMPPEESRYMAEQLGAANVLDVGKAHFAGLHGCDELPSVLQLLTT